MTVAEQALFGAVLVQVALTIVLYLALVRTRMTAMKDKAQLRPEMAYDQGAWPVKARQVSNSVASQFELPVLFFAAVLFTFALTAANWLFVALAWIFVLTRIAHALVHTGSNIIQQRFVAFVIGFAAIIVYWIALALRVYGA